MPRQGTRGLEVPGMARNPGLRRLADPSKITVAAGTTITCQGGFVLK